MYIYIIYTFVYLKSYSIFSFYSEPLPLTYSGIAKLIKNIFLEIKPIISSYFLFNTYEKLTTYRASINCHGISTTTLTSAELITI